MSQKDRKSTSQPAETVEKQLASALLGIRSATESGYDSLNLSTTPRSEASTEEAALLGQQSFSALSNGSASSLPISSVPGLAFNPDLSSLQGSRDHQHLGYLAQHGGIPSQLAATWAQNYAAISSLQKQALSNAFGLAPALDVIRARAGVAGPNSAPPQPPSPMATAQDSGEQNNAKEEVNRKRSDSSIRKEQIEAALKSKPQRGRKREDLNELERIELTRTRNREHAKTTRIRKKARYEELLEGERRLKIKENLEKARRTTVMEFVKMRQQMISTVHNSTGSMSSGDTVQVDNTQSILIHEIVEEANRFQFKVGDESMDETASALDCMTAYDRDLASRIERLFGAQALSNVRYNVRRGREGVSLDGFNGGTAEVRVHLLANPEKLLLQGFLRFEFAGSDSKKLSMIHWWPLKDYIDQRVDQLNEQISHPSVVSLDPALYADAQVSEDNQNGPGMNI